MPALANPKHEAFARNLAKGMDATDAYEAAGFKRHRGNASALRAKQNIASRVRELVEAVTERAVERIVYDKEQAMKEVEEARRMAMESGQPRAAVSAVELKSKLSGFLIDKKEVGAAGDFENMSTDELRKLLRERRAASDHLGIENRRGVTH